MRAFGLGSLMMFKPRSWKIAVMRGFRKRCPSCGQVPLFSSYLGIIQSCSACGENLHHHRADDAPPYFTIMIVGHIIIPLLLVVEKLVQPELWVHFVIWLPLTCILTLWFLPRTKGATVGLQWAFRMHGFAASDKTAKDPVIS
jgi:uncharacterized protein (DUF983 family)